MSLHHGSKIVTDGLVFAYDMGPNPGANKSWKGKPITNSYSDIFTSQSMRTHTKHFWDGKTWKVDATYSDPGVQGPKGVYLGKVAKHVSGSLNSSWSGNSYGYMLRDIASTSATTSTMSVWTYMSEDCNLDSFQCTTESATTNNIVVSGYSGVYNFSAKGAWQRLARSAVSDGNVRWIPVYPAKYGVTDGSFAGFFMWGGVQVEDNNFVSPLEPADNGVATRSNTQTLLDWTGNNTITANSLTYNSDGTFKFASQSDNISVDSNGFTLPGAKTLSIWIKSDRPLSTTDNWEVGFLNQGSTPGSMFGWMYGVGNCQDLGFWGYGAAYDMSVESTTNKWSSDGNWHNGVITMDSNRNVRCYIDGQSKQWLKHSDYTTKVDFVTLPIDTTNYFLINSRGSWNGGMSYVDLGNVMVYNKALSAAEVKQNYNALKRRYGL